MEDTIVIDFPRSKPGRTPRYGQASVASNYLPNIPSVNEQLRGMHTPQDLLHEDQEPIQVSKTEPVIVEKIVEKVIYKTDLFTEDTPHMRAEKIQAMADHAKAEARLHELGVVVAPIIESPVVTETVTVVETKSIKEPVKEKGSVFRFLFETIAIGAVTLGIWALVYFVLL